MVRYDYLVLVVSPSLASGLARVEPSILMDLELLVLLQLLLVMEISGSLVVVQKVLHLIQTRNNCCSRSLVVLQVKNTAKLG